MQPDASRGPESRTRASLEARVAWLLFAALTVAAILSIAVDLDDGDSSEPAAQASAGLSAPNSESADAGSPRSFTVAATGELLIHESVADAARTSDGWDFTPMFASVAPVLRQADLAVCHVESPMSPNNADLSYYPAFLVPNELAEAIAYAGYDTCSLASNHSTDAGRSGIAGTVGALDRAGVSHAGMALSAEARDRVTLVPAGGATVAHLSYTYGFNNGPLDDDEAHLSNVINEAVIIEEARRARAAGADFVMLSLHWGPNYTIRPDETQTDLGPRLLASAEIDLILGHHAHVIQPIAEIGGEFLVYGLGNFLSNQSPDTCSLCPVGVEDGMILHLTVSETVDGSWRASDVAYTPTWVDRSDFKIVDVSGDAASNTSGDAARDPELLAASAARTAGALSGLGTVIETRRP